MKFQPRIVARIVGSNERAAQRRICQAGSRRSRVPVSGLPPILSEHPLPGRAGPAGSEFGFLVLMLFRCGFAPELVLSRVPLPPFSCSSPHGCCSARRQ